MRAAVIALVVLAASTASASPAAQLQEARNAFKSKDCESAMKTLTFLLYPNEQLADPADIAEARSMLGACQCDTGHRDEAMEQFGKVLDVQPDRQLSDLSFSSCAIRAFDDTKSERAAKAKLVAALKKTEEERLAYEAKKNSLIFYRDQPYYVNFIPFGAGQFLERRTLQGLVFASSELLTGGVSGGIWLYLVSKYGVNSHSVPLTDGPRVRELQQLEIGAGIAFLAIYAFGVFDSLYHYEARVRVNADDSLIKDFDKKPPKKTSLRDRLHIGPLVTPTGLGVGLTLESD